MLILVSLDIGTSTHVSFLSSSQDANLVYIGFLVFPFPYDCSHLWKYTLIVQSQLTRYEKKNVLKRGMKKIIRRPNNGSRFQIQQPIATVTERLFANPWALVFR